MTGMINIEKRIRGDIKRGGEMEETINGRRGKKHI